MNDARERHAGTDLVVAGLAALTALAAIAVWAGGLSGGRGGFAVVLLLIALPAVTAWRFVDTCVDECRWDIRLVDGMAVALAVSVVLCLVLGTLGRLNLHLLMLALAAISLMSLRFTQRRGERAGFVPADGGGRIWGLADVRWPQAVMAGLVAFGIAQLARDRGLLPPVGDAIGYHLPFVAEWLQSGMLVMPVPAAGDPSPPFYPLNSSLWMFWLAAPFESDVLARFVQAPFFVLLFLVVVRLGLEIGLPAGTALVGGLLTVSLPDVIRGLSMAENDVILAALLVAVTANLALLWRAGLADSRSAVWRAAMTAVWLGLAAGTKVPAMPYVAALGAVWLAIVIYRWRSAGWKRVATVAAIGAGVVILLGSYSYIRNAVVMGNPSYPVLLDFGGEEILPGLYAATREWKESHPFYPFDWRGFFGFGKRAFFGWTVPLLVLPGLVLALGHTIRELIRHRRTPAASTRHPEVRRISSPAGTDWEETRSVVPQDDERTSFDMEKTSVSGWIVPLLLLWCGVSLAIFWFVIPYHFERFLFATLAWAIVAALWGWQAIFRGRETWLVALVIPLALVNVASLPIDADAWRRPVYVVGGLLIVGLVASVVLLSRQFRQRMNRRLVTPVVIVLALGMVVVWPLYADRYEEQRFAQWGRLSGFLGSQVEAWHWLWETTRDEPATVAVAGTNSTFPLYGPSLQNPVVTVSRDGTRQRYDWGSPFKPFGEPDRERWLAMMQAAGVDYFWVTANVSFGEWPVEAAWAEELDGFEPVIVEDDLRVWQFRGQ